MSVSVSVTSTGTQIVRPNVGEPLVSKRYEPGDPLWDFLTNHARDAFGHMPDVIGKRLVSVDVRRTESQFSFK